jgi:hypothetical protein
MLIPSFPTGIDFNLSANSVSYKEEPNAEVIGSKCILKDGEKIASFDINFEIPEGLPGLRIKGEIVPSSSEEFFIKANGGPIIYAEYNDGYIIQRDAVEGEYPNGAKRGDLWVCTIPDTKEWHEVSNFWEHVYPVFEFSGANLCGPAGAGNYRYDEEKHSYMFGKDDVASGVYSFSQGELTVASGARSHVEGYNSKATGNQSHAEGNNTLAANNQSHAEGWGTQALGKGSHSEGDSTIAYAHYSHVEGANTITGYEGEVAPEVNTLEMPSDYYDTDIHKGGYAHAEGASTLAAGKGSHAEGIKTYAKGEGSHAEGIGNVAVNKGQHVCGTYATIDDTDEYVFQVGIGTDEEDRQDAFVIKRDGTVIIWHLEEE